MRAPSEAKLCRQSSRRERGRIGESSRDAATKSTRLKGPDDDEGSALLSACHRVLGKVSENLKDGKGVFSGTGMPDMSDSAWLATKTKTETQKSESTKNAISIEPSQKDVDNLLVRFNFSLDEETIQHMCSNPDPETAFNVMVKTTTCRSESVDVVS